MSGRIEKTSGSSSISLTIPLAPELATSFPEFLALVEKAGPRQVAESARKLREEPDGQATFLNTLLSDIDVPQLTEQFLAFAFLQPYAEVARSKARLQLENYTHALCPFCNRKPGFGVLRPLGDGAQRRLTCAFCLTEWEFRRLVCPGCLEENHSKLPVYTAETFPHIRVECCDSCGTYIKSIDLTKNGLAEPLVDELASIPLDLWAQEQQYCKLHPNLLGM